MSSHLTWFTGNRNPSITETITSGGDVVDLSGSTVKFKMRAVGDDTLIVDSAVSNSPGADGVVRYDWAANDVDTAGTYLVWWEVTTGGKTQDMNEAVIEIRDHGPIADTAYLELEEFKSTAEMTGFTFADLDIPKALEAASRGIDEVTQRRFWPDVDATQVRYYTPRSTRSVQINDLIDLTSVATDGLGNGSFSEVWVENSDFVLEPLNSDGTTVPWDTIRVHPMGTQRLPVGFPRSVKVTGQFGWTAPPEAVKTATAILATRLLRRAREAPFGIVAVGLDGEAVRIARFDPDVSFLLAPYSRPRPLVG